MANIKARVGSQNAIRVLSNASAPPTKLLNLTDVSSLDKTDGNILVWDSSTELFSLTNNIDNSLIISNSNESFSESTGSLVISGGVGIGKNLNVKGTSYFTSSIIENLYVTGITTLSGITTTISDFYVNTDVYVGNNLKVSGTSNFIGTVTFRGGTINLGDGDNDDINVTGEFISNLIPNQDNTYDIGSSIKRWKNSYFSGLTSTSTLLVSDESTFLNNISITGFVTVTEGLYYDEDNYDGPNGIAYFDNFGRLIGAASTENAISETYYILTTNSVGIPTWTSIIDGGTY